MWRSFRPTVAVVVLTLSACLAGALGWARYGLAAAGPDSRVVRLHPAMRSLAAAGEAVAAGKRYVLVWRPNVTHGRGTVIDEVTGHRIPLVAPSNCTILDRFEPIGGRWVLATCSPPANSYALFDSTSRSWRRLFASDAVFAADPACASTNCRASPIALGSRWIQFYVNCVEHCYSPTYVFQNIQTGTVEPGPRGWAVGGHTIPNLDSPQLAEKLCAPLRVPTGMYGLPGTFTFFGGYGISTNAVNSGVAPPSRVFVQRCGSRARRQIDPDSLVLAANSHSVLWKVDTTGRMEKGLLLPSLRPFTLSGPAADGLPVLSRRHLFLETPSGAVWESRNTFPPPSAPR